MNRGVLLGLGTVTALCPFAISAQPSPSSWRGVPQQIIPAFQEQGAPAFTTPSGSGSFGGLQGGGPGFGDGGGSVGGGSAYETLVSESYGATAIQTAQQLGNNVNAIAAFAELESGFRNIPTSNGSSSATGPWQITTPTWNDYVAKYNLPYTQADQTNTDAQAVVANYILRDYSNQVSNSIGQPATVQQAYGAWVFGPAGGAGIASATDPNAQLSNFVSAKALSNNNMTGWTVGQFNSLVASKVGTVATQTVQG